MYYVSNILKEVAFFTEIWQFYLINSKAFWNEILSLGRHSLKRINNLYYKECAFSNLVFLIFRLLNITSLKFLCLRHLIRGRLCAVDAGTRNLYNYISYIVKTQTQPWPKLTFVGLNTKMSFHDHSPPPTTHQPPQSQCQQYLSC